MKKIWRGSRLLYILIMGLISVPIMQSVSHLFLWVCASTSLRILTNKQKKKNFNCTLFCGQIPKHPCYFILSWDFPFYMLPVAFLSFCYISKIIFRSAYPTKTIFFKTIPNPVFPQEILAQVPLFSFRMKWVHKIHYQSKNSKSLSKGLKLIIIITMSKLWENCPDYSEPIIGLVNISN